MLDLAAGRSLPSRTRAQFRAHRVVECHVEHAVIVVFGIDSALARQPIDNRIERILGSQREIEENPGLMRLGLRSYKSGGGPRRFDAETAAPEHFHLHAIRREPPRDRTSDYAAANYESFHARTFAPICRK